MTLVHEAAGLPGQIEVVAGDITDPATREALSARAGSAGRIGLAGE